jgi:hypothetical protein
VRGDHDVDVVAALAAFLLLQPATKGTSWTIGALLDLPAIGAKRHRSTALAFDAAWGDSAAG